MNYKTQLSGTKMLVEVSTVTKERNVQQSLFLMNVRGNENIYEESMVK